ncbi:Uncharacterized protein TPAR_00267 [Tolypocladium paradoxum]|uniref:Beta-1,4-mannosyl-glycoprotein 4-beta-N-acetylglucosaminyltransferase n=1 Tax=Tolypocladium paradoxum TaxID=94208 RepID=A0A2S4LAT6_9HYPO|nr:Uncharacterized protein TPAR_00267 [Tolypocladium paradoxum]
MMPIKPFLITALGLVGVVWWALSQYRHGVRQREISATDLLVRPPPLNFSSMTTHQRDMHFEYYASQAAREFCAAHSYSVFSPRSLSGERKVYDLSMVNTELDFLEIRLNTLYDYVDYFIIVESPKSFQGNPKPLMIKENWHRFERYHDKMIYHELEFPNWFNPRRAWDYEDLQRDAMYEQVFPKLTGHRAPVYGDVIIVADVDEIPRPQALLLLRTCNFPRRLTMGSKFYYYSFQFLHTGPEWAHPQATFYQGWRTVKPTTLRNGDGGVPLLRDLEKGTLDNAAWHCSSCFATIEQFLNKMASFSHGWMNANEYRDRDAIAAAVREGRDLWGRKQDTFERKESNEDLPGILLEEKDRFAYMVNRDGNTAGFTDYP